jgi:hypothetical protein
VERPREFLFNLLYNTLEGYGFVSEEAEEKLREAVDIVFDDPRNSDDDEAPESSE